MKRGKLIILEGIDLSGKDTLQWALWCALADKGISCFCTEQPYNGCDTGRLIRRILKHEIPFPGREVMTHLFAAAAYYHSEKVIKPYLEEGVTVLCNRYMYSTYAYNVTTTEEAQQVMGMHRDTVILPDMVIWLDLPVKEAMQRMTTRGSASEYYEKETTLEHVMWNYKHLFTKEMNALYDPILEGVKIIHIDATLPQEKVAAFALDAILSTYFRRK